MPNITFDASDTLLGPAIGGKRKKGTFFRRLLRAMMASRKRAAERELRRFHAFSRTLEEQPGQRDLDYALSPFNRDIA